MELLTWILSMLSFFIGYFIGRNKAQEDYEKLTTTFKSNINALKRRSIPVGTVTRPSAETVALWSNPTREEEDESFKESFTKDIGDPTK